MNDGRQPTASRTDSGKHHIMDRTEDYRPEHPDQPVIGDLVTGEAQWTPVERGMKESTRRKSQVPLIRSEVDEAPCGNNRFQKAQPCRGEAECIVVSAQIDPAWMFAPTSDPPPVPRF